MAGNIAYRLSLNSEVLHIAGIPANDTTKVRFSLIAHHGKIWKRTSSLQPFSAEIERCGVWRPTQTDDRDQNGYNLPITGWLSATADLQVIDSALKKSLDSSGMNLVNINTAVIAGVRLRVRF
jgi:hypothetical protein